MIRKIVNVLIYIVLLLIVCAIGYVTYVKFFTSATPKISKISFNNHENKIMIDFEIEDYKKHKNVYCLYKTDDNIPKANDVNWIKTSNNNCSFVIDNNVYYAFLKNEDDKIIKVDGISKFGQITSLKLNKEKIYLALNTSYTPTLEYTAVGKYDQTITWSSDNEDIAIVDENGKITALKPGNTTIHATMMNQSASINIISTDLIIERPTSYDNKKPYLKCNRYTKEENDLLDEILASRINDAGYKTRAGAVEAARFLALEFPYKIRYFSENGRLSTNGIDGEGRYYHTGLYLNSSRYDKIGKKSNGPKTWGCSLYSRPSKGYRSNGLDCSGFVSWVMLNGGFDVGDVGAGLASHLDLTDYGKRTKFNANVVNSGNVKVGDLLSSGGVNGGHIAIIVGEDDKNYYVAESLWTPPNVAVVIIAYSKKTIFNRYYYVMLMDDYYKNDGNLTQLWY